MRMRNGGGFTVMTCDYDDSTVFPPTSTPHTPEVCIKPSRLIPLPKPNVTNHGPVRVMARWVLKRSKLGQLFNGYGA